MKTFRDNEGREWIVSVDVASVKRVRSLLNVDLLSILENEAKLLGELAGDNLILLADVLYVLCKPQADQRGLTDEQFGQSLGGDSLLHGSEALLSELSHFFPGGRREVLGKVLDRLRELRQRLEAEALRKLDEFEPQLLPRVSGS